MSYERCRPGSLSRVNKKQVSAYLKKEMHASFDEHIREHGMTCQEGVAHALNAVLEATGSAIRLPCAHRRLIRRASGVAKARRHAPPARLGRFMVGGWYPVKVVDAVAEHLASHNLSLQAGVERGIVMMVAKSPGRESEKEVVDSNSAEMSAFPLAEEIEGLFGDWAWNVDENPNEQVPA